VLASELYYGDDTEHCDQMIGDSLKVGESTCIYWTLYIVCDFMYSTFRQLASLLSSGDRLLLH
jgi:hypothetical protein